MATNTATAAADSRRGIAWMLLTMFLFVSMDAVETADLMEKHILEKRAKLGI